MYTNIYIVLKSLVLWIKYPYCTFYYSKGTKFHCSARTKNAFRFIRFSLLMKAEKRRSPSKASHLKWCLLVTFSYAYNFI